ncbi:hypothetical protein GGR53DRAFT_253566 [Hypoxylon sp. FL1150]|nr:hypothetical protein GGR53DRAFT_253566 [Hypoxylon sp. FL1150]
MTGQKKEPWEYSTNKNTVRARVRKARLTDHQREVEQARASDYKAVTRALKLRAETDTYKMATADEQKMIREQVEKDVMNRRRYRGLDANTKLARFMHGLNGSAINSTATSPSIVDSRSAALASPAATDLSVKAPTDVGQNAVSSFDPLVHYEVPPPFTRQHDQGDGQQLSYGPSPSPSYHVDQAEGINYHLPTSQMIRGYGDFGSLPVMNTVHHGLTAGSVNTADTRPELEVSRDQIQHLTGQVDELSRDLMIARSTVTALETRMKNLETRILAYDDDDNASHNPRRLALKCLAEVFIEVGRQLDRSESVETVRDMD